MYSTGVQINTAIVGTERVEVDSGSAQKQVATTGSIANAPGQFGSGGMNFNRAGNILTQVSAAGLAPAATGGDYVLAVLALPANSFDVAGRTLQIQAEGSFGANTNTKRIKIVFNATTAVVGQAVTGGSVIADSTAVTTNGGGWALCAEVIKYGVANSNTQLAVHQQAQLGGSVAALLSPQPLTAVENGVILIAITGNSTTTAADILLNFLQVFAQN